MRFGPFGSLLETFQPCLLDLAYLLGHEPPAFHVAVQLCERVGRDRLAFRRAQMLQTLRRPLELGIEFANAKPRQGRLDAIDDSGLFANECLAFAVGPLRIFLYQGGDHGHLAVLPLAAQPTEKATFELLGIEPVGLGTPVLTRHPDTGGVNDMGLDTARSQPARQPEAVPAGLEGDGNTGDLVACLLRFRSPSPEKL